MICLVCRLDNRTPERGQVCEPDRQRIGRNLHDIGQLYQRIELQPGRSGAGSRPTGKPGSRLPLLVDPLDLTMPARNATVVDLRGDQIGHISVASVLDSWVRDWAPQRREHLPVPTVAVLVEWLLLRVDWACDEHDAVDEFADEIRQTVSKLRAVCGDTEPKPERLWVPCKSCNTLWMWRTAGDAYPVSCRFDGCGRKYTEDEYATWTGQVAAWAKRGEFPPQNPVDMVVIWHNTGEQVKVA